MIETVVSCIKTKDWVSPKTGQPIPIFSVGLSDGRGGQSFGKEIPIGTPMSELIIVQSQYGLDIKWNRPSGNGFQGGRKGGNESFALAYAKDLVVGGKVELKNIFATAEKFLAWLDSKKAPIVSSNNGKIIATPHPQAPAPTTEPSYPSTDDLPF
jgi:hypothetical protein